MLNINEDCFGHCQTSEGKGRESRPLCRCGPRRPSVFAAPEWKCKSPFIFRLNIILPKGRGARSTGAGARISPAFADKISRRSRSPGSLTFMAATSSNRIISPPQPIFMQIWFVRCECRPTLGEQPNAADAF